MATVTIPTNYSMDHAHLHSSRGPSLKTIFIQLAADLAAVNTRQKAIQAKLDTFIGAYNAHRILTAGGVHGAADSTNTETVLGTGAEVTIGIVAGSSDT